MWGYSIIARRCPVLCRWALDAWMRWPSAVACWESGGPSSTWRGGATRQARQCHDLQCLDRQRRRPRQEPCAAARAASERDARAASPFGNSCNPAHSDCSQRTDRRLDPSAVRRRFKAARDAAGLRPLRFHALRHAAGSLIARHADARFVQEFLGHSRITTTERYMHAKARPEDLERVNVAFATTSPSGGSAEQRHA